jgi:branched-chain amino acid transport system ATP-binding protein
MLRVEEIHTYYGDSYVLQGLSLAVEEGQIVAILGRNGMGKTTLVRSIIGMTPPRRGSIFFKGKQIAGSSPYDIAQLGIGLVPQGRRVFASLNVREHFELAHRARGQETWTIERLFELFAPLQKLQFACAGKLSGGEQQMLANGRALARNPDLILMDEPTEGLAPIRVRELGRILRELRGQGTAILLVEQNLPFAMKLADVVYVLDKGRFVHVSTPSELSKNEAVKRHYLHVG